MNEAAAAASDSKRRGGPPAPAPRPTVGRVNRARRRAHGPGRTLVFSPSIVAKATSTRWAAAGVLCQHGRIMASRGAGPPCSAARLHRRPSARWCGRRPPPGQEGVPARWRSRTAPRRARICRWSLAHRLGPRLLRDMYITVADPGGPVRTRAARRGALGAPAGQAAGQAEVYALTRPVVRTMRLAGLKMSRWTTPSAWAGGQRPGRLPDQPGQPPHGRAWPARSSRVRPSISSMLRRAAGAARRCRRWCRCGRVVHGRWPPPTRWGVHRDIKPANLMLRTRPRQGARLRPARPCPPSIRGPRAGRPVYGLRAPGSALCCTVAGSARPAGGKRTDIFSLGVCCRARHRGGTPPDRLVGRRPGTPSSRDAVAGRRPEPLRSPPPGPPWIRTSGQGPRLGPPRSRLPPHWPGDDKVIGRSQARLPAR